ncbi:MAG: hypothetical protein WCD53_29875 [Microcoleus sp.]
MAKQDEEIPGLKLSDTSFAVKLGKPLGKFFKDARSVVSDWLTKGFINLKNLAKNVIDGSKELGSALLRGDWNLFKKWLKEDPIAVIAGAGAVILAGAAVIGVVGAVGAGIAGLIGGVSVAMPYSHLS